MTAPAMKAVACGECSATMELRRGKYGLYLRCIRFPECTCVHSVNQQTGEPMGIPADAETRAARTDAHDALDRVIEMMGKRNAYRWLSMVLQIAPAETHISRFDVAMCRRVIGAVNTFLPAK